MPNWVKHSLTLKGTRADLQAFRDKCCVEKDCTRFDVEKQDYVPTGEKYRTFDFDVLVPKPEGFDTNLSSPTPLEVEALVNESRRQEIESFPWVVKERPAAGWTAETLVAFLVTRKSNLTPEEVTEAVKTVGAKTMAYATNVRLSGYPTWYEWNNHYWGTKWNACDANIGEIQPIDAKFEGTPDLPDDPCSMELYFETAWGTPEPIFKAMGEQFPNIKIDGTVDEEGGFFYADFQDSTLTYSNGTREGGPYDHSDEDEDDGEGIALPGLGGT